jgi:aminoglycoside phosphotransferase
VPRGRDPRSRDQDRDKDRDRDRKESRSPRRGSSDEDALRLREEGRSYAAVARSLDLKRSNDALAAVMRALHQRSEPERAELIGRERARLDKLEARIRDRDKDDPTRLDRRLGALEKLRSSLS